jgi:PAS domain S-box-containing protein
VIDWNAAAERMFGHAHDEAVGRELADIIIPAALRDKHRAALARWRDTREATVLNRRLALFALHASGEVFPVELTITQIAADDELFAGFVRDRREPAPAP